MKTKIPWSCREQIAGWIQSHYWGMMRCVKHFLQYINLTGAFLKETEICTVFLSLPKQTYLGLGPDAVKEYIVCTWPTNQSSPNTESEVLTEVDMTTAIFWEVTPQKCGSIPPTFRRNILSPHSGSRDKLSGDNGAGKSHKMALLAASFCWILSWFSPRTWRWR